MTGEPRRLREGIIRIMTNNDVGLIEGSGDVSGNLTSSKENMDILRIMSLLTPFNMYLDMDESGNFGVIIIPRRQEYAEHIRNPLAACEIGGKFVLSRREDFVCSYSHYGDALKSVAYDETIGRAKLQSVLREAPRGQNGPDR